VGSLFGRPNSMPLYRSLVDWSRTLAEQGISGCQMTLHCPRRLMDAIMLEVGFSDRIQDGLKLYLHCDITLILREKKEIVKHAPQDEATSCTGTTAEGISRSEAPPGDGDERRISIGDLLDHQ